MAEYGITLYGTDVYGLSLPPAYLVPNFTAVPVDYSAIRISWGKPSGTISRYRLLANRFGYPVNENDGTILFDQADYPGNTWTDHSVIPGSYHHYGFYVLADPADNIWIRSGVTGCLAPANFGSAQWLLDRMPDHFKFLYDGSDLTGDASGNSYLQQFLNILGWGLDRVRTQYETYAQYLNDPYNIPVNDLMNLAAQVGLDFAPGTPAYAMRKGVANQAHVSRQRGTALGLANEVTIRTGWGADVHLGPNMLLSTDQSAFISPAFPPWNAQVSYAVGECVWVGPASTSRVWNGTGYWYQCLVANQGQPPSGTSASNTYWACLNNSGDFAQALTNPKTSLPSTWEALNPANANGTAPAGTLGQSLGVQNLLTGASLGYAWNSLTVKNTTGSAQTIMVRSVARKTSELSAIPDPGFESGFTTIASGARPSPTWVPGTWPKAYATVKSGNGWAFPGQKGQTGGKYLASAFWTGTNCWITRTKTSPHSGTWCGQITAQGSGTMWAYSPWVAVTPNATVTASLWLRASVAATVPLQIVWRDSHGAQLSVTSGTGVALTAGTYAQLTASGTAPANAAYANITPVVPAAQSMQLDDVSVTVSTGSSGTAYTPDQNEVINNAIPVPWTRQSQAWSPAVRYATGDIVSYQGQPFLALRASTGAVPPTNDIGTPEWAPLSENGRIRICESGYASQNTSVISNQQVPVTPFAEWYDQHGNFISRVFARTASNNGSIGKPNNLAFDSFTGQSRLNSSGGVPGTATIAPWKATFWANTTMTGPAAYTRTDQTLNFTWTGKQPAQSVGITGWSASWTATFTPAVTGNYTLTLTSPGGGSRMLVNGQVVIDNWTARSTAAQNATVALSAGTSVTVEVDYYVPKAALGTTNVQPTGNPGTWTANLIPAAWTPGTLPASWTSPMFPVIAGLPYLFAVTTTSASAQLVMQVSWYNGSTLIKTNEIGTVTPVNEQGWIGLGNSPVPAGANWASVYVKVSGAKTGFAMSFKQELTASAPAGLTLTSPVPFTSTGGPQYSPYIAGRVTDDAQNSWTAKAGNFTVGAGLAIPQTTGQRTYALITGSANTQVAVTLRSSPDSGSVASGTAAQGIIFRWVSDTSYWRCDRTGLRYVSGTTWTTAATHSTPFADGDRMTVVLNSTSIKVLRNGVQVASVTNSFNSTASTHGIIANDKTVT